VGVAWKVEELVEVADAAEVLDVLEEVCGGLEADVVWLRVDCGVVDVLVAGAGAVTTKSLKSWANKNAQPGNLIPSVYVPGVIVLFTVTSTIPSS